MTSKHLVSWMFFSWDLPCMLSVNVWYSPPFPSSSAKSFSIDFTSCHQSSSPRITPAPTRTGTAAMEKAIPRMYGWQVSVVDAAIVAFEVRFQVWFVTSIFGFLVCVPYMIKIWVLEYCLRILVFFESFLSCFLGENVYVRKECTQETDVGLLIAI